MPIGTLDRSKLTEATKLWETYKGRRETHAPNLKVPFEGITAKRNEINTQIEKIVAERRLAVEKRDSDIAVVSGFPARSKDVEKEIDRVTKEIDTEKLRLGQLEKAREEGIKRRDEALESSRKQESEMAKLMGTDNMDTPWPEGSVPELSPEVRDWAENFLSISRSQTTAYFKAESEKFGAILDLRANGKEIETCKKRISDLEQQLVRQKETLEGLRQDESRAKSNAEGNKQGVLDIQKRIDGQHKELENLAYTEMLHKILGSELETVLATTRAARDEIVDRLTFVHGELRAVYHTNFPKKIQSQFSTFESTWADRNKALKGLKLGADAATNISALEREIDLVQNFAKQIDVWVGSDLLKAARDARLRELNMIKNSVCEEVTSRRNSENGFTIGPLRLIINYDVLEGIADRCEPGLPVVQDHLLEPLESAAEAAYNRAQNEVIQENLKKSNDQAEKNRLAALDDVGKEDAFKALKPTRRAGIIAPFKGLPKEQATPELVRAALQAAVTEVQTPSSTRWKSILGLPKKTFFDAKPFTDGSGKTCEVHVSFFPDCFGPAMNGLISVYKSGGTTKHTPEEVMTLLFETGVSETNRAHATVELFNSSSRKPHCYLGGLAINFHTVFQDAIEVEDDHDTNWINKSQAHAETALSDRMAVIRGKVKTWLDNDGAD
jgi:uncharacterized coiled-coil DUF342 family protein